MTVEKPGSQWLTDVFEATSPVTRHDANMHLCCNVMIRLLHPLSIHSQTHNLRSVMRKPETNTNGHTSAKYISSTLECQGHTPKQTKKKKVKHEKWS